MKSIVQSEPAVQLSPKLDVDDFSLLVGVLSLVVLFSLFNLSRPVEEDAAILMRYSKHLAGGFGIVWNIGEKPVDGATDFLFMVLLAGLAKAGLTVIAGARLLDLLSHGLTVILVCWAIRQASASRWAAAISAAYLGLGPAMTYTSGGFGTPVFALFSCLTWWSALKLRNEGPSDARSLLFSLFALTMGLIRPDGVFLACFMVLAVIYARGLRQSLHLLAIFGAVFALLGGVYFLWRWHYFGYPLPNPFYIKGKGHLYWPSLMESLSNAAVLAGPFSVVYLVGICLRKMAKETVFHLIPVLGFTVLWILLSNETNFYMRFQYAILPIVLLSWYPLWEGIRREIRLPELRDIPTPSKVALGVLVVYLLLSRAFFCSFSRSPMSPNYALGLVLADYGNKQYTMATSEAGLLPLLSGWRAIDTWGLNDQWIAHHGPITDGYLDSKRPELIVFKASFSPMVRPAPDMRLPFPHQWLSMVLSLKRYAQQRGYCLAAAYGRDPHDSYYFYVRQDFADSREIVQKIRNQEHLWSAEGTNLLNFAAPQNLDSTDQAPK